MKIAVCGELDQAQAISDAGSDFLEGSVGTLLVPEEPDEIFEPIARDAKSSPIGIPAVRRFLPGSIKCVGDEVDAARLDAFASTTFTRARRLGVSVVVFGCGKSRRVPEGFGRSRAIGQLADCLSRFAAMANERGISIALEPLNSEECNLINSLEQAAQVVDLVNHAAVGILADLYHMMREDQPPADLAKFSDKLLHVHLAEREIRSAPGVKGDDFRPYLQALRSCGYDGTVSIECRWQEFDGEVKRGVAELRAQIADVAVE